MLSLFTLATFVEVIAYGQLAAFTPLHLPRIGVAPGDVVRWVGPINSAANAFGLLFLPFWGVLADRFGRKPLIIRSFVATGSGLALASVAPNVWLFAFARGLTALNLGNSGLMMTTLHESAPAARLGFAFGVVNGAGPLGATLGPLLGGPLVDRFGFAPVLALDAALLVAVVLLLTLGYRDAFVPSPQQPAVWSSAFEGLRLIWRSPRLRTLFPALLLVFSGWMLTFIYLPIVVASIHGGADLATAGGVLWLLPWAIRDYGPFVAANAIASGIGSGMFSLSFNVLAASATDTARARVMTFAYLPLNLGFIVGPGIGALIAAGDPFSIFPAACGLQLAGLAALAYASRRPQA